MTLNRRALGLGLAGSFVWVEAGNAVDFGQCQPPFVSKNPEGRPSSGDLARVKWAPERENPDTWMLPIWRSGRPRSSEPFILTVDLLRKMLARANFPERIAATQAGTCAGNDDRLACGARLVFALRGCELANGSVRRADGAKIRAVDPDHAHFLCVIGVADLASGKISAFRASTVANRTALLRQAASPAEAIANYLPSGRYRYRVGPHGGYGDGKDRPIYRPALRQANVEGQSSTQLVCRPVSGPAGVSINGLARWSVCVPQDNIHPADTPKLPSWEAFSSEGCTAVEAMSRCPINTEISAGGAWSQFMADLGADKAPEGRAVLAVYFTGEEARLTRLDLTRLSLRPGSYGASVKTLQQLLVAYGRALRWDKAVRSGEAEDLAVFADNADNVSTDGDMGPITCLAWIRLQSRYANALAVRASRATISPIVTQALLQHMDALADAEPDGPLAQARSAANLNFSQVFTAS
jgi:hypothetical protein